jgi:hypothetical protein
MFFFVELVIKVGKVVLAFKIRVGSKAVSLFIIVKTMVAKFFICTAY